MSVKAGSVIRGFLSKDPNERLGFSNEHWFSGIMNHAFFSSIDWEALERKQLISPYVPTMKDERDLVNFPPEFTDEPVDFTSPEDQGIIQNIDQSEFEGFEYVNALLLSAEDAV